MGMYAHNYAGWSRNAKRDAICARCSDPYIMDSPRQIRCVECQKIHRREKDRERAGRNRAVRNKTNTKEQG